MKIGISAGSFRYLASKEGEYARIRELGYQTVDEYLSATDSPCYAGRQAMSEYCQSVRKIAEAFGIEISQVHGPWPTDDTTEEKRAETLKNMRLAVYGCAQMGAKHLVIHPQMPYGWAGEESADFAEELTIQLLQNLIPDCAQYGVIVCLENMPMTAHRISPMAKIAEVVAKIDSPYIGICLDTGHSNVYGHDLGEMVRIAAPWLKVLHVHDNDGSRDAHLLPYLGTADWDSFAKALAEVGFEGSLSLETTGPVSPSMPMEIRKQAECLTADTARYLAGLVDLAAVR